MKDIFKRLGLFDFIAIKHKYNLSVNNSDFYAMLKRRLKYQKHIELSEFLKSELEKHWKTGQQYN